MWPLVKSSNYFEIVSTVTFLDSLTELISGIFLYKTVILYYYILPIWKFLGCSNLATTL